MPACLRTGDDAAVIPSVVIVDDHPGFRSFARRILEAEGLRVVGEAADGESVLGVIERTDPDVVLVDVQLPGIDGFEVARLVRARATRPTVVLISTRAAEDYGPSIRESEARGFIPKADLSASAILDLLGAA
jgi:DNA-binding NarL/FixJ family response regulator